MRRKVGVALVLVACGTIAPGSAQQAPTFSGRWQAEASDGQVAHLRLDFDQRNRTWRLEVPLPQLQGNTASGFSTDGEAVDFRIERGAGHLAFVGRVAPEGGAGRFTFSPDGGFAESMADLGHERISDWQTLQLAVYRVDLRFVRDVGALGYPDATVRDLIDMGKHGVTPAFIRRTVARGLSMPIGQLIDLRIFGQASDDGRPSTDAPATSAAIW